MSQWRTVRRAAAGISRRSDGELNSGRSTLKRAPQGTLNRTGTKLKNPVSKLC